MSLRQGKGVWWEEVDDVQEIAARENKSKIYVQERVPAESAHLYEMTRTLRNTAQPGSEAGQAFIQPLKHQWGRRVKRNGKEYLFDADLVRNPINPNDVKVDSTGYGGAVDISDIISGKINAPWGEYGNVDYGRPNRYDETRLKQVAVAEALFSVRQGASPEYIKELSEALGVPLDMRWILYVATKFGYDASNPAIRYKRYLNDLSYRSRDKLELPIDVAYNELRTTNSKIAKKIIKDTVPFFKGVDSISKFFGFNLGLSNYVSDKISDKELEDRKATILDKIDPTSEYKVYRKKNLEKKNALINAIEAAKATRDAMAKEGLNTGGTDNAIKSMESRLESYERIEKAYKDGLNPLKSIQVEYEETAKVVADSVHEINEYAGNPFDKEFNQDKPLTQAMMGLVGKGKEAVDAHTARKPLQARFTSKALKTLTKAITGSLIVFKTLKASVGIIKKWNESVIKAIEANTLYNGITAATARWWAGQEYKRTLKEANYLAESRTDLAVSWSDLKDLWQPVVLDFKETVNQFLLAVNKFALAISKVAKFGIDELVNHDVGTFGHHLRSYFRKHPEFMKMVIENDIKASELYEYAGGLSNSASFFNTYGSVFKSFEEDPDFLTKFKQARASGKLESLATDEPDLTSNVVAGVVTKPTSMNFFTWSKIDTAKEFAEMPYGRMDDVKKFYEAHRDITPGDFVYLHNYLIKEGVLAPSRLKTRRGNQNEAGIYLARHPEYLQILPDYNKKHPQEAYDRLNRLVMLRGKTYDDYITQLRESGSVHGTKYNFAQQGRKKIKEDAEKLGIYPTKEEAEQLYTDILTSSTKETKDRLTDESAAYYLQKNGFGDYVTSYAGVEESATASNMRQNLEKLDSLILIAMQNLEKTTNIDKSALGILDANKQIVDNTDNVVAKEQADLNESPVMRMLRESAENLQRGGKGKPGQDMPFGWNPENPLQGRWGNGPSTEVRGL